MLENIWLLRSTSIDAVKIAKEANINPIISKILIDRNIKEPKDMQRFIRASLDDLYNPLLMKDMDKGTEIIKNSIIDNKNMVIYGDYDADGVTSTVILYKALKACGANVKYHIPDRESEGYGMNSERIKLLKEQGIDVILTCDNGIANVEEIKLAKSLNMIVVVTDHHELPFVEENGDRKYIIPEADAVINPKRKDCTYPFKHLCGAGIALKFSQVLFDKMDINIDLKEYIEIAGIGTICDVVDLVSENRIIAKNSIKYLNYTGNLGIKALKDTIGCKNINSYAIGFQIGPCINATGRLETATLAVKLFLTEDVKEAYDLAKKLHELNSERQNMTEKSVNEIVEIIENSNIKEDKVFVVYKKDIHESIAGIVAGKVREMYNIPTIIITGGKEMAKGSARSIEEYNIFEELIKCKELLYKFGGHPMAAGLTLKEENIPKFREKLNENCKLTSKDITPKIIINKRLPLNFINEDLIKDLSLLEPFGKGNSSPVLAEKNIAIQKILFLGKNKDTLKLKCSIKKNNSIIEGIAFKSSEKFIKMIRNRFGETYMKIINNPQNLYMDLIYRPFKNEYMGKESIQMRILDFRISN